MTLDKTTMTIATDKDADDTGRDNDDDNIDDDAGNDTSSTISDEGDNRVLSRGRGQGNKIIPSFICC
jgi:hypothetical protein